MQDLPTACPAKGPVDISRTLNPEPPTLPVASVVVEAVVPAVSIAAAQATHLPLPRTILPALQFFLDICAGKEAPLSTAVQVAGGCVLAPFDAHPDRGGEEHNLCKPQGQDLLFRLIWSGCVAFAHAAPPCADMSVLKLRPGGPPAVRRPDSLDGWPGQSPAHTCAMQDSATVHLLVIKALGAVRVMGRHIAWDNPPSSMALLHKEVQHFLVQMRAQVFPVARSHFYPEYEKEYLLATTYAPLRTALESVSTGRGSAAWAGRQDSNGTYISSTTVHCIRRRWQTAMQPQCDHC